MATPEEIDIVSDAPKQKRTGLSRKWHNFWGFVWNSQQSLVLGRSGESWGKIGIFYLIFYTGLGCFFACMLAIFMQTVNRDEPTYTLEANLLRENPGMGFRPMINYETTLIRFIKGNPASYKPYVDQLQAFLYPYETGRQGSSETSIKNCGEDEKIGRKEACYFSLDTFKDGDVDVCTHRQQYGFEKGEPCVLLKLNKIFGWEPEVYDNSVPFNESGIPSAARDVQFDNSVGVSCHGINPADKENIGKVSYYPPYGFKKYFFPYLNQHGYRQPLVFVKFHNITNGVLIMVRCRAWAKNIRNQKFNEKEGQAHFELLVD